MAALSAKLMSSLTLRNCDSNPFHYSRRSFSSSGTTSSSEDLLKSAGGLPKAFHPARSFPLSRESDHSRRSFVVAASSELPLVGNAAAGFEAEAGCDREFRHRKSELPRVGNAAPDFEAEAVLDQEFIKVKLSEYIGKKYVILFFYPRDFTCPTEITAFSDRYVDFKRLNTEILGVSIDSVFSHLAWVQTDRKSGGLGYLKYPLISDVTKSISKSYGVLIPDEGVALRGLFIIDKEGIIQHSSINKLAIGRRIDETMRTLQAMQSVQENPDENCRGGWKMIQRQCGWQGWDMVPWFLYLTVCGIFGLCLFRNAIDPTQGPSASVPDPTPLGRHCYVSKVRGLPLSVTDPTHGLSVPVPDPTPLGWCSISKVQAVSGKLKELSVPFAIMAFLNYNLLLPKMGESLIYWFIKTVLFN